MAREGRGTFFRFFWFIVFPLGLLLAVIFGAQMVVSKSHQYVIHDINNFQQEKGVELPNTVIVFGSGIDPDGLPRPILTQRLEAAAGLYHSGYAEKFIVSGHTSKNYDEPAAMEKYLESHDIPIGLIERDTSGDNTNKTCRRAYDDFGVERVLLVSQPRHLDRAIYLCRSKGIEAYGVAAAESGGTERRLLQSFRESMSNVKAVYSSLFD